MYTGIIQALVPVRAIDRQVDCTRLEVVLGELATNLKTGDSVAVNGVCLTATKISEQTQAISFDLIAETLDLTNLSELQTGDKVNIERSMRLTDEIGGHLVSGHVFGTVQLAEAAAASQNQRCWLECRSEWLFYIFHKGFVALDGASLTVSEVDRAGARFAVDLIPETRARTTLGQSRAGDLINFEPDSKTQTIVETLERLLADPFWVEQRKAGGLS